MFAYRARGRLGGQPIGGFVPVERGLLLSSTSEVAADEVTAFSTRVYISVWRVGLSAFVAWLSVGVTYLASV